VSTIRAVVFLLGLAFMAFGLLFAVFPRAEDRASWFGWHWLYALGLLLAIAAHGWPDGLR